MNQVLKAIRKLFRKKKTPAPVDRQTELKNTYPDFSTETVNTILSVEPYTMTSPERIEAVCSAVEYIAGQKILGDVVECGVWRGGSMMAMAQCLLRLDDSERKLHLYDTFEGMPPAQDIDKDFLDEDASELLESQDKEDPKSIWCYSGIEEVQTNMESTGYAQDLIRYVKGKVEDTLQAKFPGPIALLRLDTDWYESTKICLEVLYPKLVEGGVLIIDDYGHWQGCRKAVDEYFAKQGIAIFLQRIDYTGRIAIKPATSVSHPNRLSA